MIIGWILIALAILEVLLGLYFLLRYQKSLATTFYGLFALGSAIYAGANGAGYVSNNFFIGEKLGWVGGVLATAMFLPFSMSFPLPRKTISHILPVVLWPIIVFIPGILLTNIFVGNPANHVFGTGYETNTGPYFWLLAIFILFYWGWSLVNLIQQRKLAGGFQHTILTRVLIGTIISLTASLFFDFLLPLLTPSGFGYLGSLFTAAWLGMMAYIILVKR